MQIVLNLLIGVTQLFWNVVGEGSEVEVLLFWNLWRRQSASPIFILSTCTLHPPPPPWSRWSTSSSAARGPPATRPTRPRPPLTTQGPWPSCPPSALVGPDQNWDGTEHSSSPETRPPTTSRSIDFSAVKILRGCLIRLPSSNLPSLYLDLPSSPSAHWQTPQTGHTLICWSDSLAVLPWPRLIICKPSAGTCGGRGRG